jgi:hypothetical protein
MTNGESDARHAEVLAEALACPGTGPVGDSRTPMFGDWLRGIWAGSANPQRDGRYVRTVRRTGRMNPGTFYELTDGRGSFWQYPATSTVFIQTPAAAVEGVAPPQAPSADGVPGMGGSDA